jgi:hypothetical protein
MAKVKPLPPVEVLREHFSYDPETGIVSRLKKSAHRHKVGEQVGTVNGSGYLATQFLYQPIKVHRIAWKLHTGQEPPNQIDHINQNPTDNRWENLRAASHRLNCANRSRKRQGPGLPGTQQRSSGRWSAYGGGGSEGRIHLGTYDTVEEAHQAHVRWHMSRYGEFSTYAYAPAPLPPPAVC